MDVTAFHGAGRGRRAKAVPDRTERVDVSVFHGGLPLPPPALERMAPTLASPGPSAASVGVSPWRSAPRAAAEPARRAVPWSTETALAVILVGLVAAVSILMALLSLSRPR